jgi:hypothetical protein
MEKYYNFKDNKLTIENNKLFKKLHTSKFFDTILEERRLALKKKYAIDYVGVQLFDNTGKYFISNMGHDIWHDYSWHGEYSYEKFLDDCLPKTLSLTSNERGLMFFEKLNIGITKKSDLRASIVGNEKNGVSTMFHSETTNNNIQICITFEKDTSIASLEKSIFFSLMQDLNNMKDDFNIFMDYFKQHGTIDNSLELQQLIEKNPIVLRF